MHSLYNNLIRDAGAQALSEALQENRKIVTLSGIQLSGRGKDFLRLNALLLKIPAWVESASTKASALTEVFEARTALGLCDVVARASVLAFGDEFIDPKRSWNTAQSRDFAKAYLFSSGEAALQRALALRKLS